MTIEVKRAGATAKHWYGGGSAYFSFSKGASKGSLKCSISGNKGGPTEIWCWFDKDEFEKLSLIMIAADSDAAIKAFGKALQRIDDPTDRLDEIREEEYRRAGL